MFTSSRPLPTFFSGAPAPKDSFNVFMRLYWPKKEIVDGAWKMPGIERVK
jgi:hypothetical protein